MKKILINDRASQADDCVSSLRQLANYLSEHIVPELAELGIEVTQEILTDLLSNDCEVIQEKYKKQVEADLLEVRNPVLKKSHMKVTQDAMEGFLWKVHSISYVKREELLSIQGGEVVLTAESEKALRESFCHYLTDPNEIQKHQELQTVCDALNAFFEGKPFGFWNDFFFVEKGRYIPKNTLNYSEVVRITKCKNYESV